MSSPDDDFAKYRQLLIDVTSVTFDKGAAYTNLVMAGGYAGAFALWTLAQSNLTATASAWTGLFLLLSLTSFVSFEIYKIVFHTRNTLGLAAHLKTGKPIPEQLADVQAYNSAVTEKNVLVFMRVWVVVLAFSVGTALIAIMILVWNFVAVLCASL